MQALPWAEAVLCCDIYTVADAPMSWADVWASFANAKHLESFFPAYEMHFSQIQYKQMHLE